MMEEYLFFNAVSEEETFNASEKILDLNKNKTVEIKDLFVMSKDECGKISLRNPYKTVLKYNENSTVVKSILNIVGWPFSKFSGSDLYMTNEKKIKRFFSELFSNLNRSGFVVVVVSVSNALK